MAIVYGLKVNLSVAMVGMMNHTGIKVAFGSEGHSHDVNTTRTSEVVECQPTAPKGNVTVRI
jgi:hypothetical protein